MKKYLLGMTVLLGGMLLAACGNGSQSQNQTVSGSETEDAGKDKIEVVATFYPMYEFTKEVVGDEGNVELLIPAGTEPHDFEPSAQQIAKIADADAFVYNSSDMEIFIDDLKNAIDTDKVQMIEAAKGITRLEGTDCDHDHDHDHDEDHSHDHSHEYDPHVWLSPVLAMKEVQTIADELSEKYPDKKEIFTKNADAYIAQLKELDQKFTDGLKDAENRTFVTQHAAFAYLANEYDLTQESISGISPDQEPSPSRLAELKKFVEKNNTKVIYFEENASSKVAETLAKETGVELKVLNPLESLTSEQMEAGETYITIMEQNLEALKASIN
ncbi:MULTISPECIES: metal ABC transporter substrate-binding protein [unclassified Enterococcus]|jgi:zinc transport system substrate-binding protein|uniref:metal ABC transporter substrate-binding protein n=1 Tax=unclassified Enterococcus TaxID=2608891 RepID=UPI003D26E29B